MCSNLLDALFVVGLLRALAAFLPFAMGRVLDNLAREWDLWIAGHREAGGGKRFRKTLPGH